MQFKIKEGKSLQVLHTFEPTKGKKRYIVSCGDVIYYLNEERPSFDTILTLEELLKEIEIKSKATWRTKEYRELYLEYHLSVVSMMKSFTRNQKIDDILDKNEFDTIILAC